MHNSVGTFGILSRSDEPTLSPARDRIHRGKVLPVVAVILSDGEDVHSPREPSRPPIGTSATPEVTLLGEEPKARRRPRIYM